MKATLLYKLHSLRKFIKSFFWAVLTPFISKQPAAQLIRRMARKEWRLIVINVGSSVVEAVSEGATLAIVFIAVEVLSSPTSQEYNWANNPLVGRWPTAVSWLNALPPTQVFLTLLALAVILQALQSLTNFLNQVSMGYFAARCKALVTTLIHSQVLGLSYPCASAYMVGDLTQYAAQGPEAIRLQIELSSGLLIGFLLTVTYLAVLVGISPWLLLAVIVMGGLITLVQKQLEPRIRGGSRAVSDAQVEISSRITEDFQALRLLHTSGQLEAADQIVRTRIGNLERQLRGQVRRMAVVGPFSNFLPILAIAVIATLSLLLFGERSTGVLPSLVTFVVALQRLNVRLSGLAIITNGIAENSGRLERLNAILSPDGKQFRRQGGIPFTMLESEIRFDNVGLNYAPELQPALKSISFTLQKGQTLALVGPSGAGKSSIADLLSGLYEATEGRILVDGMDLNSLDLASWQKRLGVVSQDTILLNSTIADNISFGTPKATQDQIKAACQAAQAAAFIESLPQGYNTMLGERGYRLSGGQRQRLSLARAILRDPELLILDEATSALDSQSEQLVQEAIERFERTHTVLVIAHRLSTIVRADEILVLNGGHIVERGSHSVLLSHGGLYSTLCQQQSHTEQLKVYP